MKVLIAEDDITSQTLLRTLMSEHAECDVADNGKQAVEAFANALEENTPYDIVFLDIMMPEMDGQMALKKIREHESRRGVLGLDGTKIVMTTALDDSKNILNAFRAQCEGYLVKPIERKALVTELEKLGFSVGENV